MHSRLCSCLPCTCKYEAAERRTTYLYNVCTWLLSLHIQWNINLYVIVYNGIACYTMCKWPTIQNEIQWYTIEQWIQSAMRYNELQFNNEYNAKWGAMGYNIQWATMSNDIQWHTMTTMSLCLIVVYLIVIQWVQWLQYCSSFLQHYTSLLQHFSMFEFSDAGHVLDMYSLCIMHVLDMCFSYILESTYYVTPSPADCSWHG